MASSDLLEPIYQEDIQRLAEDINGLEETIYRLQKRLTTQGAPAELADQLSLASPPLKQAIDILLRLKGYFPVEEVDPE